MTCENCHITTAMQENLDFLVHQFILMITNADLKVCDCLKCQKKLKGFGLQTEAKTAIAADHQTLLIGSEDTNGSDNGSFCLDNFVPEAVEPISKDISRDVHESRTQLVKVETVDTASDDGVIEGFRLIEQNFDGDSETEMDATSPVLPSTSRQYGSEGELPVVRAVNRRRSNTRCCHCGKVFASRETLSRHIIRHGPPKLSCPVCGMGFYRKDSLHDHINTHGSGNAYECEKCGKGYNNRNSFRWHRTYSCGGAPPPKRKKRC